MNKQLGYDLIGAALEVFHEQGGGMAEEIYQQSLEHELFLRAIPFDAKKELQVKYKDIILKKTYIPDLFIEDKIIAELKSVKKLTNEHMAQLLNYMRITGIKTGYLINFGNHKKLEWERFVI